jgi:hypothetical protein
MSQRESKSSGNGKNIDHEGVTAPRADDLVAAVHRTVQSRCPGREHEINWNARSGPSPPGTFRRLLSIEAFRPAG